MIPAPQRFGFLIALLCFVLLRRILCLSIEPVGSVSPKINTGDDYNHIKGKFSQDLSLLCPAQAYPQPFYSVRPKVNPQDKHQFIDVELNNNYALLCLAQSYPTPAFSFLVHVVNKRREKHSNLPFVEPVGSVKPKINVQDKLQTREIGQNVGFALLCPAQSYPMPAFSVPPKVGIADELSNTRTVLGASFSLKCPAQSYPIPAYRADWQCSTQEPVASVPPKLNLLERVRTMEVLLGSQYAMQCPGQAFPVPINSVLVRRILCPSLEPVLRGPHEMNSHLRELNLDLPRLLFVQPNRIPCLHLEPVGSVAPKVDIKDEINYARAALNQSLAIVCPAQSYPVPSFRYVPFQHSALWGFFWDFFLRLFKIAEPVGSVAPKVDPNDRIKWVDKPKGVSLSLLCPAQSYPTPAARVAPKVDVKDRITWLDKPSGESLNLLCPAQSYPMPAYRVIPCLLLEPVGSVAPKVEIKDKLGIFVAKSSCSMALLCPAQSYPMPAFSVAPRVNRKDEFNHDRISSSQAIAIQCPAQSYPVPAYRACGQRGTTCQQTGWSDTRQHSTWANCCYLLSRSGLSEPVGSVGPKISVGERLKDAASQLNSTFTLFCPAQSYPVPAFRQFMFSDLQHYFNTVFIEPVGSVGPRLTSGDKTRNVDVSLDGSFTLLCPAQAYPVPFFRGAAPRVALIQKTNIEYVRIDETVAIMCPAQGYPVPAFRSTVPKVVSLAKFDMKTYEGSSTLALLCPAQGYPVPAFSPYRAQLLRCRLYSRVPWLWQDIQVFPFYVQLRDILRLVFEPIGSSPPKINALTYKPNVVELHAATAILCPAQGYPAPSFRLIRFHCFVQPKVIRRLVFEPVSAKGPTLSIDTKWSGIERHLGTDIVLLCPAQAFPVPVSRAPTFSTDYNSFSYARPVGHSFALLCQAQGFPVPAMRTNRSESANLLNRFQFFLIHPGKPIGHVKPRIAIKSIEINEVSLNGTFVGHCPGQGYPVPVYRWYKFIEGTTRKQAVVLNDRVKQVSGTLIIKDAVVEDSGKYLCVVNNSVGGESVETVLTVTAPLSAKIDPPTQTIDFGRPAVFTCQYTGNPIKTVSWMKDGKAMGHSEPVLRIESVKKEDKGMYQCFVRNDQESAEASAELKLGGRFDPPVIRQAFQEETMEPGPSVFLKCVAGGNPTPEISWELDGKKIANNDRFQVGQYVTVNGDVVSYLNITSVHANDGGLYKCIAKSKVGVAEHSAKLNVYGLPYIRQMEKKAIVAGETLMVTCPVAGYPIDSIVWERDNRALPINRKQKVFPNGTLIIENVERNSDQATYTCVAKNQEGYSARGSLEVQVMVPPQIVPFDFGEETINMNEMVSATCTINKGDTPLEVYWTTAPEPKLGVARLMSNDGILITKTTQRISMLSIESVHARHRANYTCVARNAAGIVYHTAELRVNGDELSFVCLLLPQIVPFEFGEESVNELDMVSASCTVNKGDLPIDVAWTKNGGRVYTNDGIVVTKTSTRMSVLSIESVRARHAGNYSCVATNNAGESRHWAILAVNVLPQIVPFDFGEESINELDMVSVSCTVNKGDLPVDIYWTKNGGRLYTNDGLLVNRNSQRLSVLSIESVRARHAGNYSCVATNNAGATRQSAMLAVNVLPQVLPFVFGEESINELDMVSAYCTVNKGDLPLDIAWTKNGGRVFTNDGVVVTRNSQRISVLSIESVRARHAGNYSCVATNNAGETRQSAMLAVNVPPSIAPFSFGDDPVNTGENAGVQCMVQKGDVPITIKWTLNSRPIINGEEGITILKLSPKTSVLNIAAVEQYHRGTFKCIAENLAGSSYTTSELKVNVPPHVLPFNFGSEVFNMGDVLGINCVVLKGDLPLEIHWTLNDEIIESEKDGFTVMQLNSRTSYLSVDALEAKHRGVYSCIAQNLAGRAIFAAELQVNVAPQISPFNFGDEPLNRGEVASVTCVVPKGDLPLDIYWTLNSALIVNGELGFTIVRLNKRTSSLNVDSLEASHRGSYKCIANNSAGYAEYVATLDVNVPPQIQPFDFGVEPANTGEIAGVFCMVPKGDLPMEIRWTLNSAPIITGEHGFSLSRLNPRTSSLSIDALEARHRGIYKCIATNKAGGAEYSAELHENVPPQVLPFGFGEAAADVGDIASANCVVPKGDLPLEIRWSLNSAPIVNGENGFSLVRLNKRTSSLNIDSLSAYHRGVYKCIATNEAGSSEYLAELQVNVPPQVMPFVFGDEPSNYGDSTAVQCMVFKGDTPLQLHWTLNGQPITNENVGIRIIKMSPKLSSLSIDSINGHHRGLFKCIASNAAGSAEQTAELVVNVPPQIRPFDFGDEASNSGETMGIQCTVIKGDLPINISWALNNQTLTSGDWDVVIGRMSSKSSTLNIDYISAEHRGIYTCRASNRAGESSYSAELKVNVLPSIFPFSFEGESNEGDSVQLTCHVAKGDLPLRIRWTHNDLPLFPHLGVMASKIGERVSLLTVETVKAVHSGNYSCVASNNAGNISYTAELFVNVLPQIVPFDYDDVINTGDSIDLFCQIQRGDRPMRVHWSFERRASDTDPASSDELQPQMRTNRISVKTSMLSIPSASPAHTGTYTCIASNAAGTTSYGVNLTVNVSPKIAPFDFGEEPLNYGEPASVQCTILGGDLPINVTWLLNNATIDSYHDISFSRIGKRINVLSIESVSAHHAGFYSCHAQNKAGLTAHSARLIVNVPPKITPFSFGTEPMNFGEPVSVHCTISGGDLPVSVIWTLNRHPLLPELEIFTEKRGQRIHNLMIDAIEAKHAGNYTCIASNSAGRAEHSAELIVNALPRISAFSFGEESMSYGEFVNVQCTISGGDLPVNITWTLNNRPFEDYLEILTTKRGKRINELTIEAVSAKHAGNYSCIAENRAGRVNHTAELKVNVAPKIAEFDFGKDPSNFGESASVQCLVISGDFPVSFAWLFNGREINENVYDVSMVKLGKKISALSIDFVRDHHAGNYTCVAVNRATSVNYTAELVVNVPPKIAHFDFGDHAINFEESVSVNCLIYLGDLPMDITWLFNGAHIQAYTGVSIVKGGKKASILTIDSVHAGHAGNYTCKARNDADSAEYSAQLIVNAPPKIAPFDFGGAPANFEDSVSVNCLVTSGDLPIEIEWLFEGAPVNYAAGIAVLRGGKRTSLLTIDSVHAGHAGNYSCKAKNKASSSEFSAALIVNVPPKITPFSFGEEPANVEDSVSVTCLISTGDLPIDIEWLFNHYGISSYSGIMVMKGGKRNSVLSIDNVHASHVGNYTCRARNQAAAVNYTTELIVNAPPKITPFTFGEEPTNVEDSVSVTCLISSGDLPIDIEWLFNDFGISSYSGINVVKGGKRNSMLSIDNVQPRHAGKYSCRVKNHAAAVNYTTELIVNVPPKITPFDFGEEPTNVEDSVSVTCLISSGDLPIDIEWLFNDYGISSYSGINVLKGGKRSSVLGIDNVQARHAGMYSCRARNHAAAVNYTTELIVNVPPKIIPFTFGDEPTNVEDSVSVTCLISSGDLPIDIEWLFNDYGISSYSGVTVMKGGKRTSMLTIDNVSARHAGKYSCLARNHAAAVNHTTELIVNAPPKLAPFDFGEAPANFEDSVSVNCLVSSGDLPIDIEWLFNGQPISFASGIAVLRGGKRTSVLTIDSVHAGHAGNYSCKAKNKASSSEFSAELIVNVPPKITPFNFGDEPANVEDSVSIMCLISTGDSPIDIEWLFNDYGISSYSGINVVKGGKRNSMLSIDSVQARHAGRYSCRARNHAAAVNYTTELIVNVAPKIAHFDFGETPVNFEDSVSVNCLVSSGDLPLDIEWLFNEYPINHYSGISTSKMGKRLSVLMIDAVNARHVGNYTCKAKNLWASSSYTAQLLVNVPPHITPFEFGDEPANFGDSVTVQCTISKGDLPVDIYWLFNDYAINEYHGVTTSKIGKKVNVLTIDSVNGNNAGNYTCRARNNAQTVEYSAALIVNVLPQITPFATSDQPTHLGQYITYQCTLTEGDLPLNIRWTFNKQPLFNDDDQDILIAKMGRRSSVLTIESVAARHAGNYSCHGENAAGKASYSTQLKVIVLPRIIPFAFEEGPAQVGQYLTLHCSVPGGDLPLQIDWTLNGQSIGVELGISTERVGSRGSVLTIEAVEAPHAGNFTCHASNLAGRQRYTTLLDVYVPPKLAPLPINSPLYVGDYYQLTCAVVHGDAPFNITWYYNGQPAGQLAGVNILMHSRRSSSLNIESVQGGNAGTYTCMGANGAGFTTVETNLSVRELPQIEQFHFNANGVNGGQAVRVMCMVTSGDLPIDIYWLKNGQPLLRSIYHKIDEYTLILSLRQTTISDSGNYTCVASNAAGQASRWSTLKVKEPPLLAALSLSTSVCDVNDYVQLTCIASRGATPIRFEWQLNGRALHDDDDDNTDATQATVGEHTSLLLVNKAQAHHAGNYSCRASNHVGVAQRHAMLIVNVPPRWILEPTDKAFAQGSDAKVECKADGFPKPQVTWKKAVGDTPGEYKDLKKSDNIRVEEGTLHIDNIQKTNEGYYLCEAINGIGSGLSAVIMVSVQAPPEFTEKLRNQTARRGEPAVLQCEAKGEKPIGILWNMNNMRLDPKNDNRYTIREEILSAGVMSSLSIKRTERSDSALFTCVATNAFGSDDASINMIVQEVPEMPYALKVLDKSGRSVQLSWAQPYDGNSPLNRYIIEFKRSRASWDEIDRVMVPGHTTEAQVQKLSPATTYNIRIVAENEIGSSQSSEAVTIITAEEAPSGKPQTIKVEPVNQTTLRVTWKPPARSDWNGEILGYYVGYKLSNTNSSYIFETINFITEEGKEHNLELNNLRVYTQYSVVIQAFNKIGAGPLSDEEKQFTAEGTPSQPPSDTACTTLTSQTIRVSWVSPPLESANGVIKTYKVVYAPSDEWYDETKRHYKKTASSDTVLHGLKKYTNYTMQVLATTAGGDGVRSVPIHCQTEPDVPEAPTDVKALVMGNAAILVSWRPPAQPNGIITQYTVYSKAEGAETETKTQKVPHYQMSFEATELEKNKPYEFWVTASTTIGEGQQSKSIVAMPSDQVPAKIASFDDTFTATFKEDAKMPCLAVGAPQPEITWKIKGVDFSANDRMRLLPDGSLLIKSVNRQDAGDYSCHAENSIAKDSITHKLIVLAPPQSPHVTLSATTTDALTVRLKPHEGDTAPLHGYTLHYKPEFGEWETAEVSVDSQKHNIENLLCGSRYQVYATGFNNIGAGEASDILNTRTKGQKPKLPEKPRFIEVSSNSVSLHFKAWKDGGCPMSHFVVESKKRDQLEWNQISNNVKPDNNYVVLDLEPATWYNLRITAHNSAGFTVAEYDFATLTVTGGTIAPLDDGLGHGNNVHARIPLPAWMPEWLDLNFMVPLIATVVVVAVGICVVCVALSRRRADDLRGGQKDVYYDVVYNQTMGPGATLDKRRPDLRDELGYIAPPNRKLPPVPGSNYNTCDRIKRGRGGLRSNHSTWDPRRNPNLYEELKAPPVPMHGNANANIYGGHAHMPNVECHYRHPGMEDEICPYATFHLLGFREEMDPTKAMNFQTFPHQNGHTPVPGHAGTMLPPGHPGHVHSRSGSQSMPRANRYQRKNSQGGQSSIYTPAPEYDDPANCAEEDQYRRYTRVNSQGGSLYSGPGPEYDDPANCAPEEDQYGSQYGGPYGQPYDHYGSRGSMGRRSIGSARNPGNGSPEPPPPPPRNHDMSNSSFNDSKESNEISEAECDRDHGPRGNYGETKPAQNNSNSNKQMAQDSQPTILWQCNL
ncbi:hypothetical protein ACLKA6_019693 [Drosophila palustris]